jgi:hypothetical protein
MAEEPCVGLAKTVYINTVCDRVFSDFPAKMLHICRIYMVLANLS